MAGGTTELAPPVGHRELDGNEKAPSPDRRRGFVPSRGMSSERAIAGSALPTGLAYGASTSRTASKVRLFSVVFSEGFPRA